VGCNGIVAASALVISWRLNRGGKPPAMNALALLLYAMGNMSFCGIGRLLQVSDVSVLRWARAAALELPEPEMPADVEFVNLEEMHHFIKKRRTKYGFGERLILSSGELYPGFWSA
jgi:transposase